MIYTWLSQRFQVPKLPEHITTGFYHNEMNNAYHSSDRMDAFAEQINSYSPSLVIDAGCGMNIWKDSIDNVIGFDRVPGGDFIGSFDDFDSQVSPSSADFVFCLGSVHDIEDMSNSVQCIHDKIALVHKWLKPGGIAVMRVRSDVEELYQLNQDIPRRPDLYSWSISDISTWTQEFNFNIIKPIELRQVLLSNISYNDLIKFREKFKNHIDVLSTIEKEIARRHNQEIVKVPVVMKGWYIWWWQKK